MPISRSRWSTDRSLRRLRTRKQHPHHGRRIAETFRGIVGRHLEVEGILKGAMSTQRTTQELRLEFARLAASSATIQERAAEILEQLGRIVAFDVGWLALRDPELRRHVPLATAGDAEPLREYFARPEADDDVESLGLNRLRPPILASEIPGPLSEVRAWGEHLLPAGLRQGLAVGLFTSGGRHVGFLSLLSADRSHPSHAERNVVAACTTVIADGIDRTREIAETTRAIQRPPPVSC